LPSLAAPEAAHYSYEQLFSRVAQSVKFQLLCTDRHTAARRGQLQTAHGLVETPAFMPVGTQATVKGILPEHLRATGTQMILANTYHLMLRPGEKVIGAVGGLHRFMGWERSILTDSGGFQLYSLAQLVEVSDKGAIFRSHIDGSRWELSPERAMELQAVLGSDIAMVLDDVVALPADKERLRTATERTIHWAERCQRVTRPANQSLFAIVQGGLDRSLREWCAARLVEMNFDGYAIGGLSVGESPEEMYQVVRLVAPLLPDDKPRYLMGVGRPQDILEAVSSGVDLFDCVLPTRNGRNATAFTHQGILRLRNQQHTQDPRPLQEDCSCPACRFSRAYLRHLFMAKEMLGPVLLSIHNITFYQRLMAECREAIAAGRFEDFRQEKLALWRDENSSAVGPSIL